MGARRTLTRAVLATLVMVTVLPGPPAVAQPGSIDDQIAAADADLKAAQATLADTYAAFTAADERFKTLSAAATAAAAEVARTSAEAEAAATREQQARQELDQFASASYRHGSGMFSARAYLGADSPGELLDRASMLTVLAGQNGDVMDATQQAVDDKVQADTDARAASDQAVLDRDAASGAKTAAEQAYNSAVATQDEVKAEVAQLADRRAALTPVVPQQQQQPQGGNVQTATGAVVRPAQGRLTSTYGARGGTIHYGVDIANKIGTPILSAMAGEVIDSGPASGFGLWVRVRHSGGLITVYGHINESLVRVGQQVSAGAQIATMGNRGQSTGPHLHFEVHQDGRKIDPLPWLRSHGISL